MYISLHIEKSKCCKTILKYFIVTKCHKKVSGFHLARMYWISPSVVDTKMMAGLS